MLHSLSQIFFCYLLLTSKCFYLIMMSFYTFRKTIWAQITATILSCLGQSMLRMMHLKRWFILALKAINLNWIHIFPVVLIFNARLCDVWALTDFLRIWCKLLFLNLQLQFAVLKVSFFTVTHRKENYQVIKTIYIFITPDRTVLLKIYLFHVWIHHKIKKYYLRMY